MEAPMLTRRALLAGGLLLPALARAEPELVVGSSLPLSGPSRWLGAQMRLGMEARFAEANQSGGVQGRRVALQVLDDGYVPELAEANTSRLIDEGVVAVLGNVGTPTAARTLPVVLARKTLLLGAFTGAGILRKEPPDRYVVNYRASYADETQEMVRGLVKIGIRPYEIAFFTQDDGYGDAGYQGAVDALRAYGYLHAEHLPHGRYERNTVKVEGALMTLLRADTPPRAIIMIGTGAPCARFIRLARGVLPRALFLNVSFVGAAALAAELGALAEGVIVTEVVPDPAEALPLCQRFLQALGQGSAAEPASRVALEGYIVASILMEAFARGGTERESLIDTIERLGSLDLGLGEPLTFGPGHHQGSRRVWPTLLSKGHSAPLRWEDPSLVR